LHTFLIVPTLASVTQKDREARHTGATIKALREAYGWQLSKFAIAVGMSHAHLSNIEAGRKVPTIQTLRRISDVLGIPLAALTTNFDVEDIAS
jgi:transcriptional regulator with XRE-family HTH domain